MKTKIYNPSPLELEFANAIKDLKTEIEKRIESHQILDIEHHLNADNPSVVFKLVDKDGDKHEIVVKFIQRMEE